MSDQPATAAGNPRPIPQCGLCRFAAGYSDGSIDCERFPPVVIEWRQGRGSATTSATGTVRDLIYAAADGQVAVFGRPKVRADEWCGEFTPRPSQ